MNFLMKLQENNYIFLYTFFGSFGIFSILFLTETRLLIRDVYIISFAYFKNLFSFMKTPRYFFIDFFEIFSNTL